MIRCLKDKQTTDNRQLDRSRNRQHRDDLTDEHAMCAEAGSGLVSRLCLSNDHHSKFIKALPSSITVCVSVTKSALLSVFLHEEMIKTILEIRQKKEACSLKLSEFYTQFWNN